MLSTVVHDWLIELSLCRAHFAASVLSMVCVAVGRRSHDTEPSTIIVPARSPMVQLAWEKFVAWVKDVGNWESVTIRGLGPQFPSVRRVISQWAWLARNWQFRTAFGDSWYCEVRSPGVLVSVCLSISPSACWQIFMKLRYGIRPDSKKNRLDFRQSVYFWADDISLHKHYNFTKLWTCEGKV